MARLRDGVHFPTLLIYCLTAGHSISYVTPITDEHLCASFGASRCWLTTPGQPRRRKKLPGRYCSPTQVLAITGEVFLNHIQAFSNCSRGDKLMQTHTIKYDNIPDEVYLNMLLYLIHSKI